MGEKRQQFAEVRYRQPRGHVDGDVFMGRHDGYYKFPVDWEVQFEGEWLKIFAPPGGNGNKPLMFATPRENVIHLKWLWD